MEKGVSCSRSTVPTGAKNANRHKQSKRPPTVATRENGEKIRQLLMWSRCHRVIRSLTTNALAWSSSCTRPALNVTKPNGNSEKHKPKLSGRHTPHESS